MPVPPFVAVLTVISLTPPAAAQDRLDAVPYVGAYRPMGDMVSGDTNGLQPVTQQPTFALGARFTVWLRSGVGLEGTLGYAPSHVNSGVTYDCCNAAHVIMASTRVVAPIGETNGSVSLRLGGGLGLVAHGGRAYIHVGGATSVAGTASAGIAIKLPSSRLRLRLDVEDYVFKPSLSARPGCDTGGYTGVCGHLARLTSYKSPLQNDFVLSAGLALSRDVH